jgi:hypothetical protein
MRYVSVFSADPAVMDQRCASAAAPCPYCGKPTDSGVCDDCRELAVVAVTSGWRAAEARLALNRMAGRADISGLEMAIGMSQAMSRQSMLNTMGMALRVAR